MIILGEFLKKIYGTETKDAPQIWIYDGFDCEVESGSTDGLLRFSKAVIFQRSAYQKTCLKSKLRES